LASNRSLQRAIASLEQWSRDLESQKNQSLINMILSICFPIHLFLYSRFGVAI
jgi:hypothetical protein